MPPHNLDSSDAHIAIPTEEIVALKVSVRSMGRALDRLLKKHESAEADARAEARAAAEKSEAAAVSRALREAKIDGELRTLRAEVQSFSGALSRLAGDLLPAGTTSSESRAPHPGLAPDHEVERTRAVTKVYLAVAAAVGALGTLAAGVAAKVAGLFGSS